MNKQLSFALLALLFSFQATSLFADDGDSLLLVPKTVKRKARKLASLDSEVPTYPVTVSRATTRTSSKTSENKETLIRISLLGGRDSLSSSGNDLRTTLGYGVVDSQWAVAVQSSLIYGKYLGLELDTFYNVPASATGTAQNTTQSQLGVMANPMVRYPVRFGSLIVTPKIGAGFGYLSINETDSTSTSASQKISTGITGLYGTLGFDVEVSDFLFTADYARSLTASASYGVSGSSGNALTGASAQVGNYSRIRVGLFYHLSQSIYLGGQFISRMVDMSTNTSVDGNIVSNNNTTNYNQYLAGLMFQF